MLYKSSHSKNINWKEFENPPSEYRSAPFWAWNCKLDKDMLTEQLEMLKKMGFGGVHIHSRTGMATEYLSEEFFCLIEDCRKKAQELGMLVWLYDEDRWPSGSAGGYVTKKKEFRARHLLFTPEKKQTNANRRFLGGYAVSLDSNGYLVNYRYISEAVTEDMDLEEIPENEVIWYAYQEMSEESPWYNNQTYVNTLDKKAVDEFCRITHESYKKNFGDYFGGQIPAIFTDEPQFTKKTALNFAWDQMDVKLPWTDDLPETYYKLYGFDLLERIPELIWDLSDGKVSKARYAYHAHISDRFAEAYAENLGEWCKRNGIMLTGHMMEEPTLKSQTAALGEVMRSLSEFQLPGIDILCDRREYTTAKQAQSVARQYGREGVMSESYGVTGWDFDFRGHKLQADWQAALGITARAPHLAWVSMEGEAKRDYPASINYQVPWSSKYRIIEEHIGRINTVMTRGIPLVKTAVIHPVESYWLHWGPQEQSAEIRSYLENNFKNITEWLLFGQIDFDYISESIFPKQCQEAAFPLAVGEMKYETVIVPGCMTLRSSTLKRLRSFAEAGGSVLFAGSYPEYIDAEALIGYDWEKIGRRIAFDRYHILNELENMRELDIRTGTGERAQSFLYQMREEGENRYLFLAHGTLPIPHGEEPLPPAKDVISQENIQIRVKGHWKPVLCDTMTGKRRNMKCSYSGERTEIAMTCYAHDSLLFMLTPGIWEGEMPDTQRPAVWEPSRPGRHSLEPEDAPGIYIGSGAEDGRAPSKVRITLSEPNVLVLDCAYYALDGEPYGNKKEEILRIDNRLRKRLGLPLRQDHVAQPWVVEEEKAGHQIRMLFKIKSEVSLQQVMLALEQADNTVVIWNGVRCESAAEGYYTDFSIKTLPLGALKKGENQLELIVPFGKRTNTENVFLLGDFCVQAEGSETMITPARTALPFGDITRMGYPFYGGNITYHLEIETERENVYVRCPMYRGAVIEVYADKEYAGDIAFAPYQAAIKNMKPGRHKVDLVLYGSRVNTFGALHNCNEYFWWHGPDDYRVNRDEWSYEYQLKPAGILKCPEIFDDERYAKA